MIDKVYADMEQLELSFAPDHTKLKELKKWFSFELEYIKHEYMRSLQEHKLQLQAQAEEIEKQNIIWMQKFERNKA